MMRKLLVALLVVTLPSVASAEESILINGSGSALEAMEPLVDAYRKANPAVTIVMEKPLGSSGAIKALLADALDLVVSSKPLKPEEAGKGAMARDFGKTPLLFVTNDSVKQNNITTRDVEAYYSGKRTTWPDGSMLRLVLRPEGDIDTTIVRSLSPAVNAAITLAMKRPGMITAVTDPEAVEQITKTPGALGEASLSTLVVKKPKNINPLALNGVKASVKTLADGSYPLGKDIRFITTPKTPPAAHKFIDFVFSAKGRALAERAGVLVTATPRGSR